MDEQSQSLLINYHHTPGAVVCFAFFSTFHECIKQNYRHGVDWVLFCTQNQQQQSQYEEQTFTELFTVASDNLESVVPHVSV